MNQNLYHWAKQQLEKEKKHLVDVIEEMNNDGLGVSLAESLEELSTYDQHPADVASEVFERGKDFALRENAMIQVRAIEQALDKMQDGTYGLCEVCGQQIPLERLKAVPYTTYCINCRHQEEKIDNRGNMRPVEEDLSTPSWPQFFADDAGEKNMYDTEDTWQDLAPWQEHAPGAGAGSYYGGGEAEESIGYTETTDHIPYGVGDDGVVYQRTKDVDDTAAPVEQIDTGV